MHSPVDNVAAGVTVTKMVMTVSIIRRFENGQIIDEVVALGPVAARQALAAMQAKEAAVKDQLGRV